MGIYHHLSKTGNRAAKFTYHTNLHRRIGRRSRGWELGAFGLPRTLYAPKKIVIQKKFKKFQIFFGIKHDQVLYSYKKFGQEMIHIDFTAKKTSL